MVKMKQKTGRAGKIPFALAMGWLAGMVSTLVMAAALTQMILSGNMEETSAGIGAMVILGISAAVDALVSALISKKRWLQVCLGAGGLYFATLLAMGGILFEGSFSGVGTGLIVTLCASAGVGLFALKRENRASVKRNFQRYG